MTKTTETTLKANRSDLSIAIKMQFAINLLSEYLFWHWSRNLFFHYGRIILDVSANACTSSNILAKGISLWCRSYGFGLIAKSNYCQWRTKITLRFIGDASLTQSRTLQAAVPKIQSHQRWDVICVLVWHWQIHRSQVNCLDKQKNDIVFLLMSSSSSPSSKPTWHCIEM